MHKKASIFSIEMVEVKEDDEHGRYSVAKQYLDVGTVVAREMSLASALFPDKVFSYHKIFSQF
jgi:hypothetical protein